MEGARPAVGPLPASGWRSRRAGRWALSLVERARGGEAAAFEQIFREHGQEIYRYCLAILRHPSDAEDALQATMSSALRALPGERREIELRPWLYRVAYNEAISLLRSRAREADPDALADAQVGSALTEAEERERLRELVDDLNGLPDRQRGALVMRELSGLSYAEIGTVLDSGERAARQLVYEAREALRMREEGRKMDCRKVRRTISAGDRRRLRGRKVRAHLTACDECAGFERAIGRRREDLQALCPPLPLAAATSIAGGLGAGPGASVGAGLAAGGAGAVGGGLFAAGSLKGVSGVAAAILAVAAVGGGELIISGEQGGTGQAPAPPPAQGAPAPGSPATPAASGDAGTGSGSASRRSARPGASSPGLDRRTRYAGGPAREVPAKPGPGSAGNGRHGSPEGGRSAGAVKLPKAEKAAKPAPRGHAGKPGAGAGSASVPGKGGPSAAPAQPPANGTGSGQANPGKANGEGATGSPGLPMAGGNNPLTNPRAPR